jgi:small subunit ribosomal protein S17
MPKRILTGKVTSNKSDKTITVLVERKIMHPMYKKFVTKSKKFAAHDGENKYKVGDIVNIRECAPISKNKRFEVIK